jgi:ubiquitin-protein ligase
VTTTDPERRRRLQSECLRLQALAAASRGHVSIHPSRSLQHYVVRFHNTPGPIMDGDGYRIVDSHELTIELPDEFPAQRPLLSFAAALLSPNCYSNGRLCAVDHVWNPQRHLDQVVCDALEQIQGVNPNLRSVANGQAVAIWSDPEAAAQLREAIGRPILLVPPAAVAGRRGIVSTARAGAAPAPKPPIATIRSGAAAPGLRAQSRQHIVITRRA